MPDAVDRNLRHIREDCDGETPFVLRPANSDLFCRTGRQIIESSQLGISIEVWIQELDAMVKHVAAWCQRNDSHVRTCYCAPSGGTVLFFFSPKSGHCDFDLADALTDLNLELVRQFNVGEVEVRQIPWSDIDRFLCPQTAELVYGERFTSSPSMEA